MKVFILCDYTIVSTVLTQYFAGVHQVTIDFEVHIEEYVSRRDRLVPSSSSRINLPHLFPSNLTNVKELGCICRERSNVTHTVYTFRGICKALLSDSNLYPFDSLGMYSLSSTLTDIHIITF